ncbi:hypothetical protein KEM48_014525 [Puccinia striiformis f. sp. tritici PST-130]|nr:hypothetical protein KEM48_014525 [Puccinia striiformis f. sp. tritici PST-130]
MPQDRPSASTPATPPAGGTSLFGAIGGLVSATVQTASSGASTAATTVSTALSGAGSAVANVTVTAVDHLNCASSAQNINTCVAQGTKDVSNCAQTNDACLCQTYGNLARCYSSCKSLSAQVDQYQSQSADHCMKAGLKPNSTASVSSPTSSVSSPTSSDSSPTSSNSSSTSPTLSQTFSRTRRPQTPPVTRRPQREEISIYFGSVGSLRKCAIIFFSARFDFTLRPSCTSRISRRSVHLVLPALKLGS